jgi:hydrophobic/amphiphilic exporter-1 (mainly G- bacteria), HAE1 family
MFGKFIERPVLSIVISLVITLLGVLAISQLPVEQFPEIAPPEVNVTAQYPGANAEVLVKAVVRPLERVINGVPGMKYMISTAGNDGTAIIQVRFNTGTNTEMAAVNVQNRVSTVVGSLPAEVRENGLEVKKEVNSMLMYLNISSADTTLDEKFLYNFAQINIYDELKRIEGVGFIDVMGQREYAIRVWLKPDRMVSFNISAQEVLSALEEQNIEAAPGQVGESSDKAPQSLQYALLYPGKFTDEKQYGDIILRADPDGRLVRLKDIADLELSTEFYDVKAKLNGHACASIMLKQLPGSNAQDVIKRVKSRMVELRKELFLSGMEYSISYDVSRFLQASVKDLMKTFIEAYILVFLVVFLFLQDFRSTLIPALAVPVSLIGTFFFMQFFGLSINMITLFALVLAIGIVVDNAIVVVEAVHARMEKKSLDPKKATLEAMKEISGAIIAMTIVMAAVFIPVTFMGGPVGVFYRQFAITMAIAIIISGITALTLSPALCAIILKPIHAQKNIIPANPVKRILWRFDHWYKGLEGRYQKLIRFIVNRRMITYGSLILFLLGTWGLSVITPTGFIPNEDQGTIYGSVTLPRASTLERTESLVDEVEHIAGSIDGVESVSSLAGQNIMADGTGPIYGTLIINLKEWNKRNKSVNDIIPTLYAKTSHIKSAELDFFAPPPVPGYTSAGGFELYLEDKSGTDNLKKMQEVTDQFIAELRKRPEIQSVFTIFDASFPQYMLYIDYEKAAQKGITVNAAFSNLQTLIGSVYATNFVRFGKMFKVMVQADPKYRAKPEDVLNLTVKNDAGKMVPYSAFMRMEQVYGPEKIIRNNMYTAAPISGDAAPGYSTGDVIKAVQEVAGNKLPQGYGFEWSGITFDEVNYSGKGIVIFLISLVFVYLILAAQYESFLLPFPVLLFLPLGTFGAFVFITLFGLENNIYAQVALLMLIGILGKNAILIVEIASQRLREGSTIIEAAVTGATSRLRPILMTSFAFTAGLIPLMLATGVGANGNKTIGAAAAGGMIFGTLFGVIIIPGLYIVFATLAQKFAKTEISVEKALTEDL